MMVMVDSTTGCPGKKHSSEVSDEDIHMIIFDPLDTMDYFRRWTILNNIFLPYRPFCIQCPKYPDGPKLSWISVPEISERYF